MLGLDLGVFHRRARESSRTTGLYDRRDDDISLDEVARIAKRSRNVFPCFVR